VILFDKSHIELANDEMTSKKLDGFLIFYSTPVKGLLEASLIGLLASRDDDGVITSYSEAGKYFPKTFSDIEYKSVDTLEELHRFYSRKLENWNPNVVFTTQIIKPV